MSILTKRDSIEELFPEKNAEGASAGASQAGKAQHSPTAAPDMADPLDTAGLDSQPSSTRNRSHTEASPPATILSKSPESSPDTSRPKSKSHSAADKTAMGTDIGRSLKLFGDRLAADMEASSKRLAAKMKEDRDKARVRLLWDRRKERVRSIKRKFALQPLDKTTYLFELLFEQGDVIDEEKVRQVAYFGLPARTRLRSLVWKLFLGYLPWDRRQWHEKLTQQRSLYRELLHQFVVDGMNDSTWKSPSGTPWAKEILKDVLRTMPESPFFHRNALQHEALMNMLIIYAKVSKCHPLRSTSAATTPPHNSSFDRLCCLDEPRHRLRPRNERNFSSAVFSLLHGQPGVLAFWIACCALVPL